LLTVALGWASQFCRDLTKSFADVYVFTVPLFLPKRDGRDGKWRVVRFLLFCQNPRAGRYSSPDPAAFRRPTR
jgi:hypothetical protein